MNLGPKVAPAASPEAPEWVPHPNGRKHFFKNTKTGAEAYRPPSPYGEPPPKPKPSRGNPEDALPEVD